MAKSSLQNLAKLVKNVTDNKPVHEVFLMELCKTIEDTDEKRKPSQSYKPSSLGGCMRNLYFQVTGAPTDGGNRSYSNIGITDSGTSRHETLQKAIYAMKKQGFDCEWISVKEWIRRRKPAGTKVVKVTGMETKCYNDVLNISFLCDGIVKYKGIYYIIEIKTETFYKFQGQVNVFEEHKTQASTYSTCLEIDNVLFIYENRDTCTLKSFPLAITPQMKEDLVLGKIETCNGYVASGIVPPKSTVKKDCTYCQYLKECGRR